MPVRPQAAKSKEEEGPDSGAGDEAAVANQRQKKRECKVQWIDDCGKDLTQILEFEPSDSDDSDDDNNDGQLLQVCACLIQ
jgi:hypothetical protein